MIVLVFKKVEKHCWNRESRFGVTAIRTRASCPLAPDLVRFWSSVYESAADLLIVALNGWGGGEYSHFLDLPYERLLKSVVIRVDFKKR